MQIIKRDFLREVIGWIDSGHNIKSIHNQYHTIGIESEVEAPVWQYAWLNSK